MSLDTSNLHRGNLWAWRLRSGHLEVREAYGEWIPVGVERDLPQLHEFYGVQFKPFPWRPWHPVRDWFLRRKARAAYERWKAQTKHSVRLEQKRRARLAQFKAMERMK
jgi:hypothetical protein